MPKLGISVYPEDSSLDSIKDYMKTAACFGYSIVFTLLRSKNADSFVEVANYARELGMEIFADCTPEVLDNHGITDLTDLENIQKLGLSGVRLDAVYSGREEARMSYNKQDIKVILNASVGSNYIQNVIENKANTLNIITYHNFYPKRYTGLSREFTHHVLSFAKQKGLRTGAFISSQNNQASTPGPIVEGLCTIEDHRHLPLSVQYKELMFNETVDDIIIGNAFASQEELKELSHLNSTSKTIRIIIEKELDESTKQILESSLFELRYDYSEYMHRASNKRNISIDPFNNNIEIDIGDITMDNSHYLSYSGEVGIALRPMEPNLAVNKVGKVVEEELNLIHLIKPGDKIRFEIV